MMFRNLVLSFVLLTNSSFTQNAPLSADRAYKPFTNTSFAQNTGANASGVDSSYKLSLRNPVQDKNFYLLSLFQQNPEVGKLLRRNPGLKKLSNNKAHALKMAANCDDVVCLDRLFRFPSPTIEMVATELKALRSI